MLIISQLPDAVEATRKIGLEATVFLIVLLALLSSFALVFRWMLKKIDKKDDQLLQQIDSRREDSARAMDARREDMKTIESAMRLTAEALKDGASNMKSAFDDLARDVRGRK